MSDQAVTTEAPAPSGEVAPSREVPKGSSVSDAARILAEQRKQKGIDRAQAAPSRPSVTPPVQDAPEELPRESAEAHGEGEGEIPADVQTEIADSVESVEAEDIPATLDAWADALGVDRDTLAEGMTTTVKVNGRDVEVTLGEALAGYRRQSDYSRAHDELAEQRKAFEAEREQITGEAKARIQMADQWLSVLADTLQAGPDDNQLAQLATTDPDAYTAAKAHRDHLMNQFQQVVRQREALEAHTQQQQSQLRERQHETEVAELTRLSRNKANGLPDFSNAEQRKAWESKAAGYLESRGTSQENIAKFLSRGGWTANQVAILNDAMRYRELMSSQKGVGEQLKGKPKVILPKAGQQRGQRQAAEDNVKQAIGRLQRTGSNADAQAILRARREQRAMSRRQAR